MAESEIVSDDSYGSMVSSTFMEEPWVTQFCEAQHHEYFCEVSEDFIQDEFNLTGLSQLVPRYKEALELILDLEPEQPVRLPEVPSIEESGELLYGLIHARFIITRQGLLTMAQKYESLDFGTCPRYLCDNIGLLPMGRHDMPGFETVRLYCPCCRDLYVPPSSRFLNIDGAFFGSSFPAMFLDFCPDIEEACRKIRVKQYVPKLFGFRISEYSPAGPRMKWLRQTPESDAYLQSEDEKLQEEAQKPSGLDDEMVLS